MTTTMSFRSGCFVLGLTCVVSAQDARSTLAGLTQEAAAVAQVRALNVRIAGATRHVHFKVVRTLKGTPGTTVALAEPTRQACGSALHGVLRNSSYLAFLRKDGKLVVHSTRALVPLTPDTLRHVRDLLAATSAHDRLTTLTQALDARDLRVRQDAALGLAQSAELESLDPACRAACVRHLGNALLRDDRAVLSLMSIAQRLRLQTAADVLVGHYLRDRRGRLDGLVLETLDTLPAQRVVSAFETAAPSDVHGLRRGIALLSRCGSTGAQRCLTQLSKHGNPAVATLATTSLEQVQAARTSPRVIRFRSILK